MTIVVHKYHANGNDFILTETEACITTLSARKKLADRKTGIGCDQILFLQHNQTITRCTFYNQDGNAASLCLNGLYVVSQHLINHYGESDYLIETEKAIYKTTWHQDTLSLTIPATSCQQVTRYDIPLKKWQTYTAHHVNVGNPHLLINVPENELNSFPLDQVGQALQTCRPFLDGVNVSCITENKQNETIFMRIFERGVGITESCGSAALATAYLIEQQNKYKKVQIEQPGGTITLVKPELVDNQIAWLLQSNCCHVAKISLVPQPA